MQAKLFTDGGSRGNPGPAAAGVVLTFSDTTTKELGVYLGKCTNNEAEYQALLAGLTLALEHNVTALACFLDSELVVKQLNGVYKVKNVRMQELYMQVKKLEKQFEKITYTSVPREQNSQADGLVNQVLDSTAA